ncbi:hypothetical protein [Micromonospora sp. NPDC093277]|uniref:hypothetical protein n=1 Tax=Micromonospora sp. NPDC093277 TaxID=3364291 RepID=UPI0038158146
MTPTVFHRRRRGIAGTSVLAVLATLIVLPGLLLGTATRAVAAGPVIGPPEGVDGPMTLTQTMDDTYGADLGRTFLGSVTVSQTTGLIRQRVTVSWSGLRPTVNGSPPVVVMQCWGAPSAVTPQRCWYPNRGDTALVNRLDPKLPAGQTLDPAVWGESVESDVTAGAIPFTARDGRSYFSFSDGLPGGIFPDYPTSALYPQGVILSNPPDRSQATLNEVTAVSNESGAGSQPVELIPAADLPSLGCSDRQECSLVVVPVGPIGCRPIGEYPELYADFADFLDEYCQNNQSTIGSDTWMTPTNWDRRFVFPLTFRATPEVCAQDTRPETGLVGSPLVAPLMASWRPRFCLDKALFKLGYTDVPEGDARRQFVAGLDEPDGGLGALLSSRPLDEKPDKPLAYAPVAVNGFAVSYILDTTDEQGNTREVTQLRFNARLLAKLITQSYPGGGPGQSSPVKNNPRWWAADPEFKALNPGLNPFDNPAGSTFPILLQGDQDLVHALTAYIASDPAAVAWLTGAPDEWGMRVNPKFRGWAVPAEQFELREDWTTPGTSNDVYGNVVWFNLAANQVATLREAALAMVRAWPTSITEPLISTGQPVTYKRVLAQTVGTRALLAIVDNGSAAQFGLRRAELRNRAGEFVAPTSAAMAYALQTVRTDKATGVVSVDHATLDARGYPGTMPVYAVVPKAGLPKAVADRYATFLEYAASTGQHVGFAAGDLPDGYLPLPPAMQAVTTAAAKAVRDQGAGATPTQTPKPSTRPTDRTDTGAGSTGTPPAGQALDPDATPSVPSSGGAPSPGPVPSSPGVPSPAPSAVVPASATTTAASPAARWLLPVLLALALVAGVVAPVATVVTRPGHPLGARLSRLRNALRGR